MWLCKSISERGFPFSEWILGDTLWIKRPNWYWDGLHDAEMERGNEEKGEKKEKSVHFSYTHVWHTIPFALSPPQREMSAWWKGMSFHYERIVRTDRRGPERGGCAFWQVNMWNSYANRYANCVSERMLAHCELFHSKQPWPKLWIMTGFGFGKDM